MKKPGLLIILAVNVIILFFAGYLLYGYISGDKKPLPSPDFANNRPAPAQKKSNEKKSNEKESLKPKEGPAEIKIVSIPAEAKVFVNGYYKGKTPVKFKIVSTSGVEKPLFTLIKPGYKKWNRNLEIISGRRKEYRVILEKN